MIYIAPKSRGESARIVIVSGGSRNRWWEERGQSQRPRGGGCGEGSGPPQKMFSILDLKMASFGALWLLKSHAGGGMHLPSPLDPPLVIVVLCPALRISVSQLY